jgi:hypothetical protein
METVLANGITCQGRKMSLGQFLKEIRTGQDGDGSGKTS